MHRKSCVVTFTIVGGMLAGGIGRVEAAPLSTAFTYQGQLKDGAAAPTGTYDLQFKLFDALIGGAQVGGTLQFDNVAVTNGLFTVSLDFSAQFNGDARWLEVGVHPGIQPVGNPFTILSPRQPLTAAAYALQTRGIVVDNNFHVGIGTATPATPLDVLLATSGNAARFQNTSAANSFATLLSSHAGSGPAVLATNSGSGRAGDFRVFSPNASDSVRGLNQGAGSAGFFEINNPANTAAAVEAQTNGTGRAGFFENTNVAANVTAVLARTSSSNTAVAAMAGVNLGAGPACIFQNGSGASEQRLDIRGDSINSDVSGFLNLMKFNNTSANSIWIGGGGGNVGIGEGAAGLPLVKLHVDGGTDASLTSSTSGYFLIGDSGAANIVMDDNEIMARDNSNPATLFLNHNGGNVNIGQGTGGNTSRLLTPILQITGGSDLSENFEVTSPGAAEPGTVLCIDRQNPGKLMPCTRAYDRTVAGAISGAGGVKTGMLMGQEGTIADGAHAVALSGRVYVRCDATAEAIDIGDLLTTSDTPGHAMNAVDRERSHGAVLGKAMTALKRGERGLVLVLVNLQ